MFSPRLTNCPECADIPKLLSEIDCKLNEYANNLYNNISFILNQPVPVITIIGLINYKRILTYKLYNSDYISCIPINKIVSKVKLLTLGCKTKTIYTPILISTTTTSTTDCIPTTTTTTTIPTTTTSTTPLITTTTTTTIPLTTTTTSTISSTTTTTTTIPHITFSGAIYQANSPDECNTLLYPYTISVPFPMPSGFAAMVTPIKIWSDIEYVEIMGVTPVVGMELKYNGITVAPGLKIYPSSTSAWVNSMELIRSALTCNIISEMWTVRIKLYGYSVTNTVPYTIYYNEMECPSCL